MAMTVRQSLRFSYTPVVNGRSPDINAARDGLQTGAAQYARLNESPIFAIRSRFGVFACGLCAKYPTQSRRSSIAMKRTLGFCGAAARATTNRLQKKSRTR